MATKVPYFIFCPKFTLVTWYITSIIIIIIIIITHCCSQGIDCILLPWYWPVHTYAISTPWGVFQSDQITGQPQNWSCTWPSLQPGTLLRMGETIAVKCFAQKGMGTCGAHVFRTLSTRGPILGLRDLCEPQAGSGSYPGKPGWIPWCIQTGWLTIGSFTT